MDMSKATEVMHMGEWQTEQADGKPVAYLVVGGMSRGQVRDFMRSLKKAGFKPKLDASHFLSLQITLTGVDAENLATMRRGFISQQQWQDSTLESGMRVSYVPINDGNMSRYDQSALYYALVSEALNHKFNYHSGVGGVYEVDGYNVARVKTIRADFTPEKIKFIDRPGIGSKFLHAFSAAADRVAEIIHSPAPQAAGQKPAAPSR